MEIKQGPFTFVEAGVLGRTKGIDGYIYCHFHDEYATHNEDSDFIFLYDGGSPFPLKIEDKKDSNGLLIKFEGSHSLEQIKRWSNKAFYFNKADLDFKTEEVAGDKINDLSLLDGFHFTDHTTDTQGEILRVVEYPHQLMVEAECNNSTVLFPLHESYILDINPEKMTLDLELPEGILNLNA